MPQQAFNTLEVNQIYHDYSVSYQDELAKLAASNKNVAYADVFSLLCSPFSNPLSTIRDSSVLIRA
jgi:hypothetical protein